MSRDEATKNFLMFLAALVEREGGQITLPTDEIEAVAERMMIGDIESLPGFLTITLVPEFVQIGNDPAPAPKTFTDEEIARMLGEIKTETLRLAQRPPGQMWAQDGALYIQSDGGPLKIATKTEWTLSRQKHDEDQPEPIAGPKAG